MPHKIAIIAARRSCGCCAGAESGQHRRCGSWIGIPVTALELSETTLAHDTALLEGSSGVSLRRLTSIFTKLKCRHLIFSNSTETELFAAVCF